MRSRDITTNSGHFVRYWWLGCVLAAAPLATSAADVPLGATLEPLLVQAQRLSPEIAARALDAAAADAGARIAGALPDPILRLTQDEIDVLGGRRRPKQIYAIEQEFPLWGKRDLRVAAGRAMADIARAQGRAAVAELTEQVTIAFAQYWVADRAITVLGSVLDIDRAIVAAAQTQMAQGRGTSAGALRAAAALTRHETEITRFNAQKRVAKGVINALLLRDPAAALANPQLLPPLPPAARMVLADLIARAQNPAIAAAQGQIAAAESNRQLARQQWYPDVTLGIAAIDRNGYGPNGYMGTIAIRVPLQVGLHRSQEDQAEAEWRAAEARRDATAQTVARALAEAVGTFAGARDVENLTRTRLIPQLDGAVRAALAAYGNGRGELSSALEAVRDLGEAKLALLAAQLDGQRAVAAIERLIGAKP